MLNTVFFCKRGGKTARDFDVEDIIAGKRSIWKRNAYQQAHPLVVLAAMGGK